MGNVHSRFINDVNWELMPAIPVLRNGDVHVYRIQISRSLHLLEPFSATLTAEERERGRKYVQLKDRQRFVISRGAQRNILSLYLKISAGQLVFALGDNKKPHLVDKVSGGMHYNITHSGDWILLAVSTVTVGADSEFIDDNFPVSDILNDNFSAGEIDFITQTQSNERFFLLWTRKEALLKATGQGLDAALALTPSLDGRQLMPNELLGAGQDWQICSFKVAEDYFGSIAIGKQISDFHFFDAKFSNSQ